MSLSFMFALNSLSSSWIKNVKKISIFCDFCFFLEKMFSLLGVRSEELNVNAKLLSIKGKVIIFF